MALLFVGGFSFVHVTCDESAVMLLVIMAMMLVLLWGRNKSCIAS